MPLGALRAGTPASASGSSPSQRQAVEDRLDRLGVERSRSVSSIRSRNVPPVWRAYSQLKSAVRAVPMCIIPVGEGAIRVTTGLSAGRVGHRFRDRERLARAGGRALSTRLSPAS